MSLPRRRRHSLSSRASSVFALAGNRHGPESQWLFCFSSSFKISCFSSSQSSGSFSTTFFEQLDAKTLELHHPARDGRPPIPLSKEGHELVERQHSEVGDESDLVWVALARLKKKGNRSWVMLRRGCLLLLDQSVPASPPSVIASSKTFARKAAKKTKLNYAELVEWLDQNSLGEFK